MFPELLDLCLKDFVSSCLGRSAHSFYDFIQNRRRDEVRRGFTQRSHHVEKERLHLGGQSLTGFNSSAQMVSHSICSLRDAGEQRTRKLSRWGGHLPLLISNLLPLIVRTV